MKHLSSSLLRVRAPIARHRARRVALACSLLLVACDASPATLVVFTDSRATAPGGVVLALPFDPATLAAPAVRAPDGPRGDSVRLAVARRDSAALADAAFQRARTGANDAARALAPLDRTSADYSGRYSAWSALADSAERLRTARDAVLRRLAALRSALGDDAPAVHTDPPIRPRRAADSAALAAGRTLTEASPTGGVATLTLEPGEWWIVETSPGGAVRLPALRVEIRGGVRDTADLSGIGNRE
jgi:hypothetical protein